MLNKLKKSDNKGFTIIEVMIVLAIAGLILLIVFLAIPALQRNSRNTQRKSETAALASAYSEFVNNHGGAAPVTVSDVADNAKLNFYKVGGVSIATIASAATALPAVPDTDSVIILVNAKCDATKTYATAQGATNSVGYSSRGGAIVFTTEGTSNTTTCISTS